MKRIICLLVVYAFCISSGKLYSQDSLLAKLLLENRYAFNTIGSAKFEGSGWDTIIAHANRNQYFLLGEIHGVNEIPVFLQALTDKVPFETFVAEIDPVLATILSNNIDQFTEAQLNDWKQLYGSYLSFYAYQQDFALLQDFAKKEIDLAGIEQVTVLNDIPVFQYLAGLTSDNDRKQAYLAMEKTSREMIEQLRFDMSKQPYLMSSRFKDDLEKLKKQPLSATEQDIVHKLEYSSQIYSSKDGHQRRIKLMKQQLMDQYKKALHKKKALVRLGANHSAKGESFLRIYDVGNLMHNLAESQLSASYHLAIFAKAGEAGHPLKGNANVKIEQRKELVLFYENALEDKWTYYDLTPLQNQLEWGKLSVTNKFVERLIKGYDGLVIIPAATAAQHME